MKKDVSIAIVAILLAVGLAYGLNAMRADLPLSPSKPFSTRTGKKPVRNENVIMRVNGEPVTEREFYYLVGQMPEQQRALLASPQGRDQLAQELVKLKVLEQEGKRRGIEADPEAASQIAFLRTNIIASYTLRDLVGQADEKSLRAEYDKQKDRFSTIDVSHILVGFDGSQIPARGGQRRTPQQAMQRANDLHARLRAGADFAATARSESDDPNSAQNGGSIGTYGGGQLPPEIEQAIFGLQPGQISTPTRSQFGIHIFKAGQRTVQPYEQVKQALAQNVQEQKAVAELKKLEDAAKVERDPKFFSASNVPRPPGGGS